VHVLVEPCAGEPLLPPAVELGGELVQERARELGLDAAASHVVVQREARAQAPQEGVQDLDPVAQIVVVQGLEGDPLYLQSLQQLAVFRGHSVRVHVRGVGHEAVHTALVVHAASMAQTTESRLRKPRPRGGVALAAPETIGPAGRLRGAHAQASEDSGIAQAQQVACDVAGHEEPERPELLGQQEREHRSHAEQQKASEGDPEHHRRAGHPEEHRPGRRPRRSVAHRFATSDRICTMRGAPNTIPIPITTVRAVVDSIRPVQKR
jgi:hypothetical protein